MTNPPPVNDSGGNGNARFVIYRADSEYKSSGRSDFTQASILGNSQITSSSKRDYIEAGLVRKDVFFIFLFVVIFLLFLGVTGYGCFLAYTPLKELGVTAYGYGETGSVHLSTIMIQIFSTIIVSGLLSIFISTMLSLAPKAIYQATIICAPMIYLALTFSIGYYWRSKTAGLIFFVLFVAHALYLVVRKKHIRMYRHLMMAATQIGEHLDKYYIPLILWGAIMCITSYAITGGFGFFKMFLDRYDSEAILYGFYFSVVVFGWLWCVNLIRHQYKMVIAGLCLNELLREGSVHEDPKDLRPRLWRYVTTRFLGQSLHSSFMLSLCELFILMVLFMKFDNLQNLIAYMFLLVACQHVVGFVFKHSGLVHNVMFGSSYFDGTFDVYIPFVFYDELCGHVLSILSLFIVSIASLVIGMVSMYYSMDVRSRATAMLLSVVSVYISLITSEVFYVFNRISVLTHIISYGENPIVLARTSPTFTEAVRVLMITEDVNIMETE